jgi:hypothetical protein
MSKHEKINFEKWWCKEELKDNRSEYTDEYLKGFIAALNFIQSLDNEKVFQ